jgi:hypothetical protein
MFFIQASSGMYFNSFFVCKIGCSDFDNWSGYFVCRFMFWWMFSLRQPLCYEAGLRDLDCLLIFYLLSTFGLQLISLNFSAKRFCCISFSYFKRFLPMSFRFCSPALKVMWRWLNYLNFSAAVFPIFFFKKVKITSLNRILKTLTWRGQQILRLK